MAQPMINRRDAIEIFRELLHADSRFRVLRLVGDPKMGKSHLVTQVYPEIVKEAGGWRCAVVDLRNRAQTSLDILHVVSSLCGGEGLFPRYAAGYRDWLVDTLLVELAGFAHLRAVVAGRCVPDAHDSYVSVTRSLELRPVEDEREYIGFCHAVGVELAEQSIRDLARALDYCPGHFVDRVISKFVRQEAGHG
jgi:hypothetical protein